MSGKLEALLARLEKELEDRLYMDDWEQGYVSGVERVIREVRGVLEE